MLPDWRVCYSKEGSGDGVVLLVRRGTRRAYAQLAGTRPASKIQLDYGSTSVPSLASDCRWISEISRWAGTSRPEQNIKHQNGQQSLEQSA